MTGKHGLLTDEISCQWRGERVNKQLLNGQDLLQGVHSEGNIHAWAVGQESCKSSFFKQSKYENLIPVKNSKHIRLHIPVLGYLALDDLLAVYLLHSLLEDRVSSGLADDQIGPLYNHNTGEEGRVTCELYNLPLLIRLRWPRTQHSGKVVEKLNNYMPSVWLKTLAHPLLAITVFQVIDVSVIPKHSNAQQWRRQEAIFSQDDKICEEPSQSLNHTCGESTSKEIQSYTSSLCNWR